MTNQQSLQQQILGDELLTREQVAELLDISPLSVARMVARGELPCLRYARRVRFRASDIRAWLNARMTYVYHGPTEEEKALVERQRTLHEACRCGHVAEKLAELLGNIPISSGQPDIDSQIAAPPVPAETVTDDLLSTKQVAEILGVAPVTLMRMLASGKLPAIKVGRRRLVRRADLVDWLKPRSGRHI